MGIIIFLLLILFGLLGCNNNKTSKSQQQKTMKSVSVNDTVSTTKQTANNSVNTSAKNVYINARFAYRIEYPKQWNNIVESETQDGALIYYKDDNDIRTFGEKAQDGYMDLEKEKYKSEGKKIDDFSTDDGVKGIIVTGDENNKKLTHVMVFQNGNHYDFYALVKPDFYKNNESTIMTMAKSIKILNK
jgi:guanyl-specific ribonuclease Sa